MLGGNVDRHEVKSADGETGMTAAEPDGETVLLGKFEIAMDLAHHVQQELVRRIATVHGAADFGGRERADISALVVKLAVVVFEPALELEAELACFRLVLHHVRDGTNAEEGVLGALRAASGGGGDRVLPGRFHVLDCRLFHLGPPGNLGQLVGCTPFHAAQKRHFRRLLRRTQSRAGANVLCKPESMT